MLSILVNLYKIFRAYPYEGISGILQKSHISVFEGTFLLLIYSCPCRHRFFADQKISSQDQAASDQPGSGIDIEQETKTAVKGKQYDDPQNPKDTGSENSDHGRGHRIAHASKGGA